MTDLTHKTAELDADQLGRANSRNRNRTITVAVLALALIGLGAWVVYDMTTVPETAVTEDIQTLLDDYLGAWNNSDGEALLELTTDGYTLDMVGESGSLTQQSEEAYELINSLGAYDWKETVIGDPIMIGEGPWFVSLVEHFAGSGYGPEGADGISTFTIVDDGGTLKVARHDYVGNN